MKSTLAQLHTAQLECEILKNDDIQDADVIRQKLVRFANFDESKR